MNTESTEKPQIAVVSPDEFGNKCWSRFNSYDFAGAHLIAPIVLSELAVAQKALPLGFVEQADSVNLVGLLGLSEGRNLFVSTTGDWLGVYVPAFFRAHPFTLLPDQEGTLTLCVDMSSGLVSEGSEGEKFFNEDGEATESIKNVLTFLGNLQESRNATVLACKAIKDAGLLTDWDINIRTAANEDSEVAKLKGLLRIDENKLAELDAEALLALRSAYALPIIYAQLFSIQNLSVFETLVGMNAGAAERNQEFSLAESDSGTLDFDSL